MATRCFFCGKGHLKGNKVTRARQELCYRTPKTFKVNLHVINLVVDGRKHKVSLCTKCLRLVKEDRRLQKEAEEKARLLAQEKETKKKNVKKEKVVEKKEKVTRKAARKIREEKKQVKEESKKKEVAKED